MGKFCTNCGKEIKEGADVCLECGASLKTVREVKKNNKDNVAKIGFILSIISIVTLFLGKFITTYPSLVLSLVAIILCAVGKKSVFNGKKAIIGLVMSIITFVINLIIVLIVVYFIINPEICQKPIVQETCDAYGPGFEARKSKDDKWECCSDALDMCLNIE